MINLEALPSCCHDGPRRPDLERNRLKSHWEHVCHATITHPLEWVEPQYNMPRVIKQLSDTSISLPRNVGSHCGFQPHFLQLHAYLGSPRYNRCSNISGLTSFHGMYLATFSIVLSHRPRTR